MTILRNAGLRSWPWVLVAAAALAGCGPKAVRGDEVAGLDDQAMSTGLDRRDLQKLLKENLDVLQNAAVVKRWEQENRPAVAVLPLRNETSEHIDSQLQALLSDIETFLVGSQLVTVISVERQQQMIAEVEKQHGGGFDPAHIVEYNRQLGAEYYITGKVFSADERTKEGRRVQYFMFTQLIDVATSAVAWQHKSELSKALIDAH